MPDSIPALIPTPVVAEMVGITPAVLSKHSHDNPVLFDAAGDPIHPAVVVGKRRLLRWPTRRILAALAITDPDDCALAVSTAQKRSRSKA